MPVEDLSWIVNAYVLTFGGFLLLGGRLADLFGRRRLFVTGLWLNAAASFASGFAGTNTALVVEDREFNAPAIEVDAGTTVTWRFQDQDGGDFVAHNVVFDGFRSPDTTQGVYEHRFDQPGSSRCRCNPHFLMNRPGRRGGQ